MGGDFNPYSEYCCPHDKLRCKRVGYDDIPSCFVFDVKGHLRFVCKRFVAPAGFSLRKQLSLETLEKMKDANSGVFDNSDFLERVR
jgi:hypothetical protein